MGIIVNSIGPKTASGTGSINGDVLTISAVSSGSFSVGHNISIAGAASAVKIVSLLSGVGGAGTYQLSAPLSVGSAAITAARDFASVELWRNSLPVSLVAEGNSYVADVYNDGEYTFTDKAWLTISAGSIETSPSCMLLIRAAEGQSFKHHPNRLANRLAYDATKGVSVLTTSNTPPIQTDVDNLIIEGIQFRTNSSGQTPALVLTGSNSKFKDCILSCNLTNAGHVAAQLRNGATAANSLFIIRNSVASTGVQGRGGAKFINCTIVRPTNSAAAGRAIGGDLAGAVEVINCAAFGFTSFAAGFNGSTITGSNNITSAASSPIVGDIVNAVYEDNFYVTTTVNNLEDFRLKDGSPAIDKGVANANSEFDIFGTYRKVPDIGAYEITQMADSLVLSGPDEGDLLTTVEFTITKNGTFNSNVVVNISEDSDGTFSPFSTVTIPASAQAATVQYTPGSVGAKTITLDNNAGLANPPAKSYAVTTPVPTGAVISQPNPDGQNLVVTFSTANNPTTATASLLPDATKPDGAVETSGIVELVSGGGTATFQRIPAGNYIIAIIVTNAGGSNLVTGTRPLSITGVDGGGEVENNLPEAPAIGTAVSGVGYVDVYFTPPANVGGGPIIDYTATLSTEEFATGTESPIRVPVSNLLSRTASVTARNSFGSGPASQQSNVVTPEGDYVPVVVVELTNNGVPITSGIQLSAVWFDQNMLTDLEAPTWKGFVTTTGATLMIEIQGSQLVAGDVGWLIITNSEGDPNSIHSAFSGPVVVQ